MDSSIPELITDNIVSTFAAMTVVGGYDFAPAAVEQERSVQIVNGRYPFVEISGPSATVDFGSHTQGDIHRLRYLLTHLDKLDDTDIDNDDPLPKQVASVIANYHKAMMVDHTRGGYAHRTQLMEYDYESYASDEGPHFEVYMIFEVETILDIFDMTKLG